jgi:hypothetical protein
MTFYWMQAYMHAFMYMLEFSGPATCVQGYHYDLGHWIYFSWDPTMEVVPVGRLKRERRATSADFAPRRTVHGVPALWCDNHKDDTFTCTSRSCF